MTYDTKAKHAPEYEGKDRYQYDSDSPGADSDGQRQHIYVSATKSLAPSS